MATTKTTTKKGSGTAETAAKPRAKRNTKTQPVALLEEVSFKKEFRCFKRGRKISFRPGVNLLVGDQGAGKSTLISLIRDACSRREHERDAARKIVKIIGEPGARLFVFDFEQENPRTKSYLEESFAALTLQLNSKFVSHGETVKQLQRMLRATVEKEKKGRFVIILDEPDMALSPRSAHELARTFAELAAKGHQIIAAVHNPILIASQPQVLSLEHRAWMPAAKFLAAHAETTSE